MAPQSIYLIDPDLPPAIAIHHTHYCGVVALSLLEFVPKMSDTDVGVVVCTSKRRQQLRIRRLFHGL